MKYDKATREDDEEEFDVDDQYIMKYDKATRRGKACFRYRYWNPVLKKITKELTAKNVAS